MFEWNHEHTVTTTATAAQVWAVWSASDQWPEWDKSIVWVRSDGPFVAGTTGKMKPVGGPVMRTRMIEATPDQSFTGRSELFLAYIDAIHTYVPAQSTGGKATIVHRLEMRGLLTPVLAFVVGDKLKRELDVSMDALVQRAERNAAYP
jgi:Polyketide cyclase / dehydrase and lipid transport